MKKVFAGLLVMLLMVTAVAAQTETVEITFAHIFGGEGDTRGDVVRAIADDFMAANPNIIVNVESSNIEYTELFNSALLAAEQGNAPTIVQIEEGLTQLAIDSGYFLPISELASEEQLADINSDMLEVVRNYYTVDGTLWSVPWNSSNPILYYNKSMTDALGIEISSTEPLTFDEITAICEGVMAAKAAIPTLTHCINWPVASWWVEQWLSMQDALYANNDNGRSGRASEVYFDSEPVMNIINWWAAMDAAGYYTYSGTPNNYNGEGALFGSGATALHFNTTAGITLFVGAFEGAGVELGIAPLAIPSESATNGVTVGGASVWVSNGQTEAETQAAVDFIFFLTNAENDIRWHQGSGYFPNRTSSIETLTTGGYVDPASGAEVSWFETFPFFRVAIDQLANSGGTIANSGPIIGPATEVRAALTQGIQSILDNDISPAEAMAAAKQSADAILADYNSLIGE
ncbi:MAG: ABC transporter substrate-binding protein [Phototrophicaceae bacterium]